MIPVLLLDNGYLYKTFKFSQPEYLGDPINTIKIFNNKEVDEIVVLDIGATSDHKEPNYALLEDLATEAFMPMAYGGGLTNVEQMHKIFSIGYEKIVLNSSLITHQDLCKQAVKVFGSQSVVASIDVVKKGSHYLVATHGGRKIHDLDPISFVQSLALSGVGEIIINSIDHDGVMQGYDLNLIEQVAQAVDIPVIACGGAGKLEDFKAAVKRGASAIAAGSFFVFYGKHRAVLITYPDYNVLERLFLGSPL